jgi:mono/diheme cytochrome c family protein
LETPDFYSVQELLQIWLSGLPDKPLGFRFGGIENTMNIRGIKLIAITTAGSLALAISLLLSSSAPTASAAVAFDGAALYKSKCASCHALDGSGNTAAGKAAKLRDLRSAEVQALSDAQLKQIIGKGKGKMPGYEKSLGADGVNQLVAYIRSIKR